MSPTAAGTHTPAGGWLRRGYGRALEAGAGLEHPAAGGIDGPAGNHRCKFLQLAIDARIAARHFRCVEVATQS